MSYISFQYGNVVKTMELYYCPDCNAILNRQSGFTDIYCSLTCTECGHTNGTSDESIIENEHKYLSCGENLKKKWEYANDFTCTECGSVLHRDYQTLLYEIL